MTILDALARLVGTDDEADHTGPVSPITERPHVESIYGDRDEASPPVAEQVLPAPPAPEPIIIRPRRASGWSTWRENLENGIPKRVAGQHYGRTSLIVRNVSAVEITVGPADDVTVDVHFPVAAGGQVTFDHTDEVWATAGAAAQLVCLAEYDNDKGGA